MEGGGDANSETWLRGVCVCVCGMVFAYGHCLLMPFFEGGVSESHLLLDGGDLIDKVRQLGEIVDDFVELFALGRC